MQNSKKNLIQNILSLSVLQAANYIVPLIVLPYLIAIIGVEKFGLIAFAQALMQYFIIVTDFGFNLSAVKEISINRENSDYRAKIFSSVMIIKLTLVSMGLIVLYILTLFVPKFSENVIIYYYSFGLVIGSFLFPVWFFQGIEKLKYSTLLAVLGKIVYLGSLLIFVTEENDFVLVPLLNSSSMILVGLISCTIIIIKFRIRPVIPEFTFILEQFKKSSQFFLSRASVSIYSSLNILVLGFLTTDSLVGYYTAAEKLFIAMRAAFNPLVQAMYPFMAYKKDIKLYKKMFAISLLLGILLAMAVYFLSDIIIATLFNPEMVMSAEILRIFSFAIPIVVASVLLGYPFLAALGRERDANFSIAIGALIHIILIALISPVISPVKVAAMVLLTETVVLGIRVRAVAKHKLWRNM